MAIPEEIKTAKRVNSEVDRLLEQAREEAKQILARAQEQATYLIEERELTRQADEMGQEIVRQARSEADAVRRGADDYAAEVLAKLEVEVMRTLKSIRLGLDLLDERRAVPTVADEPVGEMAVDEYDQSAGSEEPVRG
jgi:vacuolar-type H+-ATPase subunit H